MVSWDNLGVKEERYITREMQEANTGGKGKKNISKERKRKRGKRELMGMGWKSSYSV